MQFKPTYSIEDVINDDSYADFFVGAPVIPERHLLLAVLERGVRDLITTEAGSTFRKDAIKWFSTEKHPDYVFSYRSICSYIGITSKQLDYINTILKAAINEKVKSKRSLNAILRNRSRNFGRNRSTATITAEFLSEMSQDARNGEGYSGLVQITKKRI